LAAMATLWPSRNREGRGNDMVMILDALFKRDPSAEVRGASWAWGMFDFGMAPNEWPRWLHDSVTRSTLNPWAPPLAPLLTFLLALEANDEAAARDTARRSTHPLGRLMRAYVSAHFDNDAGAAQSEMNNLAIGPRDPSLLILHALVRARIAALNGDAHGARRAYDAISDHLYEDLPRPYWTRLLKTVAP